MVTPAIPPKETSAMNVEIIHTMTMPITCPIKTPVRRDFMEGSFKQ
jgi:hypothetical protein